MDNARTTIFNNQDAILAETQATINVALNGLSETIKQLPTDVQLHLISVVAQLASCSESISELREAVIDINNAHVRNTRVNVLSHMDEADLSRLRLEAHKDGHHGSLSEYVRNKLQ